MRRMPHRIGGRGEKPAGLTPRHLRHSSPRPERSAGPLFQTPVRRAEGRARATPTGGAISNRRPAFDGRRVTFKVKDCRIEGPGRDTTMARDRAEVRCILILPYSYVTEKETRGRLS
jgi:hypothetical protein